MQKNLFLALLIGLTGLLFSCSKDGDEPGDKSKDEQEKEWINIKISTPGTLQEIVESSKEFGENTSGIKVVGTLNGGDLKFLRALVGYKYEDLSISSKISSIDLSEASFCPSSEIYYTYQPDDASYKYSIKNSESLPNFLFAECLRLKEIHLNPKYDIISYGAFLDCPNLNKVTHGNLTKIEGRAFYKCKNLKEFDFTKVSESIGDYAFWNGYVIAQGLEGEVYLNPSIKYVGIGAFYNTKITKVTINSDIAINQNQDSFAWHSLYGEFASCYSLTEVIISEGCTDLKLDFSGSKNLKSVSFPSTLKNIGDYRKEEFGPLYLTNHFAWCVSLENITLPSSLTSIGDGCFRHTSIKELKLPSNLKLIGERAFEDCDQLLKVEFAGKDTEIRSSGFKGCGNLDRIVLPSNLKVLEDSVFKDCTNLSRIEFPKSLTSISDYAFSGCSKLDELVIPDDVILGTYVFKDCNQLKNIKLPVNYSKIPEGTFHGCKSLKTFNFPETINEIGSYAFAYSSMENIVLPPLLLKVPDYCFIGCLRLQSVEMGDKIQEFGTKSFYGCSGLTKIKIDALTPPQVGMEAFSGVSYSNVDLSVPEASISLYKEDKDWRNFFEN